MSKSLDRASAALSRVNDEWAKDPRSGKEMDFSKPFTLKSEAIAFAERNGLGKSAVKSRPAGWVVEKK